MTLASAQRLAPGLHVDEDRDEVRWRDADGEHVTGLHDYAALYAVPGLYDAVYYAHLAGGSPRLVAQVLAEVVPAQQRAARRVLDVGAGTGAVGEELARAGFPTVLGTDLEPASCTALHRDRPGVYADARALDLTAPTPEDATWLRGCAADVVTVAGAVGFGHLPAAALQAAVDLLPPGGLVALTLARGHEDEPALRDHVRVLAPLTRRAARDGVHRRTADGRALEVTALVLERPA